MMLKRREVAVGVAIVCGLIIGHFIKKATIGLVIGLFLGLFTAFLISNRDRSKNE